MSLLERIQARFGEDNDFICHSAKLAEHPAILMGYQSLIDIPNTINMLQLQAKDEAKGYKPSLIMDTVGEALAESDEEKLVSAVLTGQLIVRLEHTGVFYIVIPVSRTLSRAIEGPTTENVLHGSISAFVEDIDTNIGLVRLQAASEHLRVKTRWIGSTQQKRVVLLYQDNCADGSLITAIARCLEKNSDANIQSLQDLSKLLGLPKWTLVTNFNTTELPQEVEYALHCGKAVLLLDRMPFAIILPSLAWDMFAVHNDRSFPHVFMYLIRLLRIIGVLANLIIPGLYVALVSVNPDMLRLEMAMSIARSRIDVPYPSFVETMLLLIILELILEASIRLPKSIGPTVTMVGAIILGQAVVSARLVSNLLIIVLAATMIASSTVAGFQNSLSVRLFKYVLLVLSAVFGVIGLMSGMVLVTAYLSSVKAFGIPYLHIAKPKGERHG